MQSRTVVLLEAPHRIAQIARELEPLGQRPVTLARELTKQFEEIATVPASACSAWLAETAQRSRGEFAIVIHPRSHAASADANQGEATLRLLLAELPLKTAVRLAAELTGASRNQLYQRALALQGDGND